MSLVINNNSITFTGKVKDLPYIFSLFPGELTLRELLEDYSSHILLQYSSSNQEYLF